MSIESLKLETLPQSLLLVGGQTADALHLAKKILGPSHVHKIDTGNHPDVHIYEPEGKSQFHSMASMKKLIREMAFPPYEAKAKIFILIDAEKMLPSSSNSLLKTLEEPPEDTFFILLTDHEDALLPTIQSRLSPIRLSQNEPLSLDLSSYLELAKRGEWDVLLDKLDELKDEDPKSMFQGYLHAVSSSKFLNASALVSKAEKALAHNLRVRDVVLHLLLSLTHK